MNWLELENQIEELLIANLIVYRREGQLSARGHESGKGQSDFTILHKSVGAIEAKVVNTLTRLNYPRPKIKSPLIKSHQLKYCRERNGVVIIYDNDTEKYYAVTPSDLDKIIIESGMVKSLKGHIDHLAIDLQQFIAKIGENDNEKI